MKKSMELLGVSMGLAFVSLLLVVLFLGWLHISDSIVAYADHPLLNAVLSLSPVLLLVWALLLVVAK